MSDQGSVSIRIDPKLKKDAMKLSKDLGVSLSLVISTYLKKFLEAKCLVIGKDADLYYEYYQGPETMDVDLPAKEVLTFLKKNKK